MHKEKLRNLQEEPLSSIDSSCLFHPKYFKTCTLFILVFLVGFLFSWFFGSFFGLVFGGVFFFGWVFGFDFLTFLSYFHCFHVFSKGLKDRV